MKLIRNFCAGLTYLMCLFIFSTASAQELPNGKYAKTDFGALEVSCIASDLCFATYEDGKSFLYLTSPGRDLNFTGYWAEKESSQPCSVAHQFPNIRTKAWGNANLSFDFSANSWTGFWGYCEEQTNRKFDGTRGQQAAQQDSEDDAALNLAEWLVGSWLPTEDSGARRFDMYTFNPDSTYVISDGSTNSPLGSWVLDNAQLFLDGRSEAVPLEFLGQEIKLAGIRHAREVLNGENYNVRGILGSIQPAGVFQPDWQKLGATPKVGDYALRFIILGPADSFRPGASANAGTPVYVEFWNETEPMKVDESGLGYRDDIVVFEASEYEVGPNSLIFRGYHPDWGDLYFSGQFDGNRVAKQTQAALGGGTKPADADKPIIVGDMLVRGHIFRDIELYLAFLH